MHYTRSDQLSTRIIDAPSAEVVSLTAPLSSRVTSGASSASSEAGSARSTDVKSMGSASCGLVKVYALSLIHI